MSKNAKNFVAVATVGHLKGSGVWMAGEKIPASALDDESRDYLLSVNAIVPEDGTAVAPEDGEVAGLKAKVAELEAENKALADENAGLKAKVAGLEADLDKAGDNPQENDGSNEPDNPTDIPVDKKPEEMTKDQLKALLRSKGVEFAERSTNEQLIALIPAE